MYRIVKGKCCSGNLHPPSSSDSDLTTRWSPWLLFFGSWSKTIRTLFRLWSSHQIFTLFYFTLFLFLFYCYFLLFIFNFRVFKGKITEVFLFNSYDHGLYLQDCFTHFTWLFLGLGSRACPCNMRVHFALTVTP